MPGQCGVGEGGQIAEWGTGTSQLRKRIVTGTGNRATNAAVAAVPGAGEGKCRRQKAECRRRKPKPGGRQPKLINPEKGLESWLKVGCEKKGVNPEWRLDKT